VSRGSGVGRVFGALGRAAVAVGALLVLLAGPPFVLLRWGHWPVTGVPSWDQVRDLPVTVVSDEAVLGLVTVVLWVGWALFVVSLLAEVVAQLRGRGASTVRLGGPVQRLASYLVGSLVFSMGSMGSMGSPTSVIPAGAAAVAEPAADAVDDPVVATPWEASVVASAAQVIDDIVQQRTGQPVPSQPGTTVTVQRGDSPWSLAATHLGDGARWREIWELNQDRTQPDGEVWANPETIIRPGWQLALPGEVAPAGAPSADALAEEVTVQPGDNFWALAESKLTAEWGRSPSDAEIVEYWRAYVDGNRDRLLPPHHPDLIYPGQVFTAPAPPADPAAPPATEPAGPPNAEPAPPTQGDGEADAPAPSPDQEADAGTETDAPTPAPSDEADPGSEGSAPPRPSPELPDDSSFEPDQSGPWFPGPETGDEAGETTPMPPPTSAPETETGDAPGEAPPTSAPSPAPEAGDGGTGDETGETPPTSPPSPGPETETEAGDAPDEAETDQAAESDGGTDLRPIGLIGGGVALAGVVVLLERRRRAQQRHRRHGRQIAMPPPSLQPDEQALQSGADVDGAKLLDLALRAAATASGAAGLPPLRWVEMTIDAVLLVLQSPAPPPPSFTAIDQDRWVARRIPENLATAAARTTAPAPTLVPVGTTAESAELLVELEASGVVTVDGPEDEVIGLLRAIAVATATSPWSEDPDVVLVGLNGELAQLPGVHLVTHLAQALDMAEDRADRVDTALRSLRGPSIAQARAAGVTPEEWEPLVVVSAVPPSDLGERGRLAALADRSHRAVAVVVPAPPGDVARPGRRFSVADNGWLFIDGVDPAVQPRRLDGDDAVSVVTLLDVAGQRDDVPASEDVDELPVRRPVAAQPPAGVPDETADSEADELDVADMAALADRSGDALSIETGESSPVGEPPPAGGLAVLMAEVDVVVKVLGEVEAVRLTGPSVEERLQPSRQRGLEAITYLALRETAVDREDLEARLFPDGANAAKTIYNTISAARALVGDDLFPPSSGGRYELSPSVVTDYGLFCELVAQSDETEDVHASATLLTDALSLVRGEPFIGVGRGYAWVGPHRGMIVAQVVDAAEELAEVRLAMGDWRAAEWAARQGLLAFPSDERMYRLLMRTASAAGNIPGVQRVFRELRDVVADPDLGVEPEDTIHPETVELLERLLGRRPNTDGKGA
jgi:DNA-binding SARP family transcriptional activator/nucleoid-associated protein YgaU